MTKRFIATLRYTMAAAILGSAFTFVGCKDDDAGPTTFDGSIYAFISQDQFKQSVSGNADTALDSIVMYIDKFPDLKANLQGTSEFTFFAPSNTAFKNLTALPGLKDPDQVNPDIIKGVLAYHFVSGKKTSADLTAGASINTIYTAPGASAPDVIKVNTDGTLLTGSQNKNIQVVAADQMTTNGVVHTVGTVLIPNATGSQLSAILGTLGASVLLGKDFSYMAYMIGYADTGASAAESVTGTLVAGTNLTLLAIPNPVFVALAGGGTPTDAQIKTAITTAFSSPAIARTVLKNHILTSKYTVAVPGAGATGVTQFTAGADNLTAVSGKKLTTVTGVSPANCSCTTGVVIQGAKTGGGTSSAPIVKADISTSAGISNGILQVVGGVIVP